jgi:hypothetical protein
MMGKGLHSPQFLPCDFRSTVIILLVYSDLRLNHDDKLTGVTAPGVEGEAGRR